MHYADEMLDDPQPTTAEQFLSRAIAQDRDARVLEERGWGKQAQYMYLLSNLNFNIACRLEQGVPADDLERAIVLRAA